MVESSMYFALGFFLAALCLLAVVPLVHGRAVRLTKRRLESAVPVCAAEVVAAKDLLRAEFAMASRRLEVALDRLRTRSAMDRAELGRKSDAINRLQNEMTELRAQLNSAEEKAARQSMEPEIANPLADDASSLNASAAEGNPSQAQGRTQVEEMASLRHEIEVLRKCFAEAGAEIRAMNADHLQLESVRQELADERSKFETFHRRVAELVLQLIRKAANDDARSARTWDAPFAVTKQPGSNNDRNLFEKPAA